MAPLIDNRSDSWEPKAADRLVADYGDWHGP
jgi:hypothetical protein